LNRATTSVQASRPSSTQMAADTAELCHRRLVETQALGRAYHAALPVVCAALSVCARVQTTAGGEVGVVCVAPHPSNVDHVVVCTRSPTVYLMTLQGQACACTALHLDVRE